MPWLRFLTRRLRGLRGALLCLVLGALAVFSSAPRWLLGSAPAHADAGAGEPAPVPDPAAAASSDPDEAPGVIDVHTGVYLVNVYDLNPESSTFALDGYVWFRWKGPADLLEGLEFMNRVEKWGLTLTESYDGVTKEPDGSWFQGFRVEGHFYHRFSLADYPLDRQALELRIEHNDLDASELRFVPDVADSNIHRELSMPGWELRGFEFFPSETVYASAFGEGAPGEPMESRYSRATFSLSIERPWSYFLFTLLLPLVVVVLVSLCGFLLHPAQVDARIGLPLTALLTAVFLQQSYGSDLPQLGYMVLMDKLYALAYLTIMAGLVVAVSTGNLASDGEDPDAVARVRRIDRRALAALTFAFASGAVLVVLMR